MGLITIELTEDELIFLHEIYNYALDHFPYDHIPKSSMLGSKIAEAEDKCSQQS